MPILDRMASGRSGVEAVPYIREFVQVARWTPDEYEAWLAETLKQQLFPKK